MEGRNRRCGDCGPGDSIGGSGVFGNPLENTLEGGERLPNVDAVLVDSKLAQGALMIATAFFNDRDGLLYSAARFEVAE
jgi:hypothetical protein